MSVASVHFLITEICEFLDVQITGFLTFFTLIVQCYGRLAGSSRVR